MINTNYPASELTSRIINCAITVHKILGNGFQEVIYQRCLAYEMELQGLSFLREMEMDIYYKDFHAGKRRVDFFVENEVMLEIKAVSTLEPKHINQALNYVEAYKVRVGLLINFGSNSIEIKRVMKPPLS